MKISSVHIENFRAIKAMDLPLDPRLTVLHGNNAHGKTSVLAAIAVGLGVMPTLLARRGGINFKDSDIRGEDQCAAVRLTTTTGLTWERTSYGSKSWFERLGVGRASDTSQLTNWLSEVQAKIKDGATPALPVFALYDTERAVFSIPSRRRDFKSEFRRLDTYQDALVARASFKSLFEWFHAKENEELRLKDEQKDFNVRLPELNAVRGAIEGMMPDVHDPHIETHPLQFVVRRDGPDRRPEKLALSQLSGGYRIVLGLAADLARRMAQTNPHLADPLISEAIVLIDEIELHLHPEWQQRILEDLMRTFPGTQFIVSTHSPQVLTTVRPENIIHLRAAANGAVAEQASGPTYGARSGDVLEGEMGVQERPRNPFTEKLHHYQDLIAAGDGEGQEALKVRGELEKLSPADFDLGAADVEIARRRIMRDLARQA